MTAFQEDPQGGSDHRQPSAPVERGPEQARLDAEAFLQEAVYRSRGAQAGAGLWAAGDPGAANCGLGAQAAVDLDLTPRAQELFGALWPEVADPALVDHIRQVTAEWVERQDQLDRDRNHFLKAFRHKHGFDRAEYTAEQAAAYRSGLDEVNARVDTERGLAAERLLGRSSTG